MTESTTSMEVLNEKKFERKESDPEIIAFLVKTFKNTEQRTFAEFQGRDTQREEFGTAGDKWNSWIACFATDINGILPMLVLLRETEAIDPADFAVLDGMITTFKNEVGEFKIMYPTAKDIVPQELQNIIFDEFKAIGKYIFACLNIKETA